MSVNRLYDSVIKNHNQNPYHFEKIEADTILKAYNPICGDKFDLFIVSDGVIIQKIFFHGFGCAVSKASTSVLASVIEGTTKKKAVEICDQFLRLLKGELKENEKLKSDEFNSFAVVCEIPSRYDCAALTWMELENYLKSS